MAGRRGRRAGGGALAAPGGRALCPYSPLYYTLFYSILLRSSRLCSILLYSALFYPLLHLFITMLFTFLQTLHTTRDYYWLFCLYQLKLFKDLINKWVWIYYGRVCDKRRRLCPPPEDVLLVLRACDAHYVEDPINKAWMRRRNGEPKLMGTSYIYIYIYIDMYIRICTYIYIYI